jgi:hypothetical protein
MTGNPGIPDGAEHREIVSFMPWYVNGTIGEQDRQRVDLHLRGCAHCREDLLLERQVHERMTAETGVEYMPGASLKRLQGRLDQLQAGIPEHAAPPPAAWRRSGLTARPYRLMAASVAVGALALSVWGTNRWVQLRTRESQADYYTVTTSRTRPPNEVVRAVFSPTITLDELQGILKDSDLRIISGPSEAGVYSLAATSTRSVDSSLAILRRHESVRFAESTQQIPEPGTSR